MKIDLSGTQRFGSLTSGGGLDAVFDENDGWPNGYAESYAGWAGVSFQSCKRIDYVECTGTTNGFDGSGLATPITIQLYGKTGAAPVDAVDGLLIGSVSFTDPNAAQTVTIQSADKVTQFDHVWIRIITGVWSLLAEVRMYEAAEPEPEPAPEYLPSGTQMLLRSCNEAVPLTKYLGEMPQFRIRFAISEPRAVAVDFHGCVIHVGDGADAGVAVGYSFRVCHRSAPTFSQLGVQPFIGCENGVSGGNVCERNPDHYGQTPVVDGLFLQAGCHEISISASGHTDGSPNEGILRMLVEGGKGANRLRVLVLP